MQGFGVNHTCTCLEGGNSAGHPRPPRHAVGHPVAPTIPTPRPGLQDVTGAPQLGFKAEGGEPGVRALTSARRLRAVAAIGFRGPRVAGAAGEQGVPGVGVTVPTLTPDTRATYSASELLCGAAHWGLLSIL